MIAAVIVLMAITGIGVYGFLSAAHLEDQAPVAAVQVELDAKQQRIDQLNADKTQLQTRLTQINESINSFLKNDKATAGLAAQKTLAKERSQIQAKIETDDAEITKITAEMAPIKIKIGGVEAKLGPVKYVAQLFGWKDPEAAVRMIILMLMFAFDPLAVVLMISATISLKEWNDSRKPKPKPSPSPPRRPDLGQPGPIVEPDVAPEPPPVDETPPEPDPPFDPKAELIHLFEEHPELLDEVIDVTHQARETGPTVFDEGPPEEPHNEQPSSHLKEDDESVIRRLREIASKPWW